MYNKNMDKGSEQVKLNCKSCGAALKNDEKVCGYCGTTNPNYKPKEVKQIKPDVKNFPDISSGGFLGGILLTKKLTDWSEFDD